MKNIIITLIISLSVGWLVYTFGDHQVFKSGLVPQDYRGIIKSIIFLSSTIAASTACKISIHILNKKS